MTFTRAADTPVPKHQSWLTALTHEHTFYKSV